MRHPGAPPRGRIWKPPPRMDAPLPQGGRRPIATRSAATEVLVQDVEIDAVAGGTGPLVGWLDRGAFVPLVERRHQLPWRRARGHRRGRRLELGRVALQAG